jgi:PTS system mannose-specific IID component
MTNSTPNRPPLLPHFIRLFFLQAMWNYRNLQGTGFLFSLIPFFRRRGDRDKLDPARYHGFYNTHPYMASLAVGATLRRECDHPRDIDSIQEFHKTLAGPLGLVGDNLFWGTAKPAYALFGILISFILYGDKLAPAAAAVGFLTAYNAMHLWMRWWGLKTGWQYGDAVLTVLGKPSFVRLQPWTMAEGAVFLGLVSGAVLAMGFSLSPWIPLAVIAGGLWTWAGTTLRLPATWIVGFGLALLLLGGIVL